MVNYFIIVTKLGIFLYIFALIKFLSPIAPSLMNEPVKIFISYTQADESYKNELTIQLKLLKMQKLVEAWSDQEILPGQEWDAEIKEQLDEAEVILFLVSTDFLVSDYVNDVEIKKALERYDKGEVIIIPIVVRPTQFSGFEISKFQALPAKAKPISQWDDKDNAWLDVSNGIKKVIQSIQKKNNTKEEKLPAENNIIHSTSNHASVSGKNNTTIQDLNVQGDVNINIGQFVPDKKNKITSCDELSVFEQAQKAISKRKTQEAIDLLLNYTKENGINDKHNELLMQSGRLSGIEEEKRMGIRSMNEIDIAVNRINVALLGIIDDLKE